MWKNNEQEKSAIPKCSFCGKGQDQVNRLTAGPGEVYICDECVDLYREHIEKMAGSTSQWRNSRMYVPHAELVLLQAIATATIVVLNSRR